jgi:spermidine synthase/Flp pilus assembly protein TadD
MQRATRGERVLYYKEGENGSVLVGSDAQDQVRWLRVGGKIDASTGDMETQVLLGLLPSALADSGARSLVIGLGSGYTAASVLAAGAGPTDVVELERGVVEASEYFFPRPDQNPLRDPRVHLILGDARTHLAHTRTRYGIIVSEPSNPWIAGVNNLFTVDFYQRVRARLDPDGVFCQWMQLYEISPETIGSMIGSFLKVFPEGEVFTVWRAVDLLLVAAPRGRAFALERLRSPDARRMLDAAHIATPEDVSAYWTGPIASLAPLARGATLNRDDRPVVEYRAPRDLVAVGRAALTGSPGATRLVPFAEHMPDGPVFAAWPREDWYARRARHLIALADTTRARAAISGARAEGFLALAERLDGEVEAGLRRREAEDVIQQATNLLALGRADEGRLALERAAALDPSDPRAWLLLCDRRRVAGDIAGAETALAHVVPGDSEQRADVSVMRSLLALARRDTASALASIQSAVALAPTNPRAYLFEARLRISRGDLNGARAALQRGLAVLPGNPDLANALNDLGP